MLPLFCHNIRIALASLAGTEPLEGGSDLSVAFMVLPLELSPL
jgi:hypothetical protein